MSIFSNRKKAPKPKTCRGVPENSHSGTVQDDSVDKREQTQVRDGKAKEGLERLVGLGDTATRVPGSHRIGRQSSQ